MREALSYSPGICWVATIILASHLAWITILFVFSEILLLQKEAMKVLKFRKKLNQSPWGEGGKLDNTEWFRKEYWLKRWGPHSVIFDNRLDHASSRKKISIFFFFFCHQCLQLWYHVLFIQQWTGRDIICIDRPVVVPFWLFSIHLVNAVF